MTEDDKRLAAAKAAIREQVPANLRKDLDDLDRLIAEQEKVKAAAERRMKELRRERTQIMKAAAQAADSDHALVTLRHADPDAYSRLAERIREIHPALWGSANYVPVLSDRTYDGPLYLGVTVHLTRHRLPHVTTEGLAAALLEFARRFVTDTPDEGVVPGMIYAQVRTVEGYPLALHYTPDGSRAILFDDARVSYGGAERVEGDLKAVLAVAIAAAEAEMRALDDADD